MIAQLRPIVHGDPEPALPAPRLWGIVLAGGDEADGGDRHLVVRPRHARAVPRTCCPESLFRETLERATRLIPADRLVAVLSRARAAAYEPELRALPDVRRLVQPLYRGSAAEIFLPLLRIVREDPEATVVVLPSDHLVDQGSRFMQYVARAALAASRRPDLPILIGARPRSPEPTYGWIEPGDLVEGLEAFAVRTVKRFVHEPRPAERRRLFEERALLSTLVMVAHGRTLVGLGQRYLPEVLETLEPLQAADGPEARLLGDALYECLPYASVSRELLERGPAFGVLAIPDVMWTESSGPSVHKLAS